MLHSGVFRDNRKERDSSRQDADILCDALGDPGSVAVLIIGSKYFPLWFSAAVVASIGKLIITIELGVDLRIEGAYRMNNPLYLIKSLLLFSAFFSPSSKREPNSSGLHKSITDTQWTKPILVQNNE